MFNSSPDSLYTNYFAEPIEITEGRFSSDIRPVDVTPGPFVQYGYSAPSVTQVQAAQDMLNRPSATLQQRAAALQVLGAQPTNNALVIIGLAVLAFALFSGKSA